MNRIATALLLATIMALSGCGSNSRVAGAINGTWQATLTSTSGDIVALNFVFLTTLTVNADGTLGTSNFTLTTNNTSCNFTTTTESGSFTLTGNLNGQVSGTFHYVVTSTGATVNTLTLNGTVSGGTITGNWTVSGASSGCSGSGTFTMTPPVQG